MILRDKLTRAGIGPLPAVAHRIEPDSPLWEPATTALLTARQNTPPGDRRAFWAEHCTVWSVRLSGTGEPSATTVVPPD